MSLFGKKPSPEEYVKKWKRELKKEERDLDRNIRSIELEEQKIKRSIKELAKKQNLASAKTLAKELIRSRKAKENIYKSKAQLNSVAMQLQQNLSMMKLAGVMQKSTQVMAMMNRLVRLPQLNQVMMTMAREMEKAGLIEEIMSDAMGDDDEIADAADEEVEKVLDEITSGLKNPVPNHDLLSKQKGEEDEDLQERLGALKA